MSDGEGAAPGGGGGHGDRGAGRGDGGGGGGGGEQRLLDELRRPPAPALTRALSDEELGRLADQVRSARRRQSEALRTAGEGALASLPWVLRGPVRKAAGE